MADLPSVALLKIFQYQNRFQVKNISSLVCRKWKLVAEDPLLWRKATVVILPSAESCIYLSQWITALITKGHVKFSFHRNCARKLILEVCEIAAESMTYLSINGSRNIDGNAILQILSYTRSIEVLALPSCFGFVEFTSLLLSSATFRNIQHLLPNLSDVDIGHTTTGIIFNYPISFLRCLNAVMLQSLGLSGLVFSTAEEPALLDLLKSFRQLRKLDISFINLSEAFLNNLADLELLYLDELNVVGCQNITAAIIENFFLKFSLLKRMYIKNVKEEMSYANVFYYISRSNCSLECLRFNNSWVQPNIAKLLQSNMFPQLQRTTSALSLKKLDLSYCPIGENFLALLAANLRVCDSLILASCNISDSVVLAVCKELSDLQELDISRNRKITDLAFLCSCRYDQVKEVMSAKEIQKITVCKEQCANISMMRRMEVLSLSFLTKLTDVGFMSILHLENLRSLSLKGCRALTSTGRIKLYKKLCVLMYLDLSELEVEDKEVQILTENLKYLTGLNLSGTNITHQSLDLIDINCPLLRNLDILYCENLSKGEVLGFLKCLGRRLNKFQSTWNIAYELLPVV